MLRDPVVLLVIFIGFVLAVSNRLYSVLFYWWLAIFRPQDWIWGDISALRISLFAGLIVVVGCSIAGQFPLLSGIIPLLMLAFLALEIIASFLVGCEIAWTWVDQLFRLFLLLFFTSRLVDGPRKFIMLVFVVGGALMFYAGKAGLSALLAGGASQFGATNFTGGSFIDSNGFAHGTAVLVFYWLAAALNVRRLLATDTSSRAEGRAKLEKPLAWLMFGVALLATFNVASLSSRGSLLALGGGWLLFTVYRRGLFLRIVKLIPILTLIFLLVPLPSTLTERLDAAFADDSGEMDSSAASRPQLWMAAIDMSRKYPLGVGPNCFPYRLGEVRPNGINGSTFKAVHSSQFQALAEAGYVGFLVFVLLVTIALGKLFGVRRRSKHVSLDAEDRVFLETSATCMLCALLVFLAGGMFYSHLHQETLWMTVVLADVLSRISKSLVQRAESLNC